MNPDLVRYGPRFTMWFDFNLEFLFPHFKYSKGLGYIHLGWLSFIFGFDKARDFLWDTFDKGTFGE